MKHSKFNIIGALSLFIVLAGCGNNEQNAPTAAAPPATFPVTQIQTKTVTGYTEYPATIEGIVNSEVRAKTSGYVQKVLVDEGQKVSKGQVLFKLETQTLNQDAGAAKAQINVAQVEVDKLIPLVEKNIISSVQLETAKANLAQAKANYSSIAASIGYATVRSSVDGFVGAINFREGSLVSPSDQTPLTTVSDISRVYAFFSLNESQYLDFIQNTDGKNLKEKLANFPEVSLILANGSTYTETGEIQTSSGQINQSTGTVSFRAVFDNPNQLITNGNSGKIQIPTAYEDVIVVPQTATYEQQGNVMLYKLGEDNKVISTIVKVKATVDNIYVLQSGLTVDEKIVSSGVGKLRNDMPITPKEVSFEEATQPIPTLFKN